MKALFRFDNLQHKHFKKLRLVSLTQFQLCLVSQAPACDCNCYQLSPGEENEVPPPAQLQN